VAGDAYAASVSLSASGEVLAVGAPNAAVADAAGALMDRAGRVRVYQRLGRVWLERTQPASQPALQGRNAADAMGMAVALNEDGSVLAASEPLHSGGDGGDRAGAVRVFQHNNVGSYQQLGQELRGSSRSAFFGAALALSSSGQYLVVGAPYSSSGQLQYQGEVRVYELNGSRWDLLGDPLQGGASNDWFGSAVALHEDDQALTITASAPHSSQTTGFVQVWQWPKDGRRKEWTRLGANDMINDQGNQIVDDRFGHSLSITKTATSQGGSTFRVAVGVPLKDHPNSGRENVGMTVVYDLNPVTNLWMAAGLPIWATAEFEEAGYSVRLMEGGDLLAVSAPGWDNEIGAVRFYRLQQDAWLQSRVALTGSTAGDDFGYSMAVSENVFGLVMAVGSLRSTRSDPGSVTIFEE
jgi:hypothetical protein